MTFNQFVAGLGPEWSTGPDGRSVRMTQGDRSIVGVDLGGRIEVWRMLARVMEDMMAGRMIWD